MPFAVGQIDPSRGFVHVLDDVSMNILLDTLDTVSDFVNYLEKKEAFIASGKFGAATGEEDLLAYYMGNLNDKGEHDFFVPPHVDNISIDETLWPSFRDSRQRRAQLEADSISYTWDALIEQFSKNVLGGTLYYGPNGDVSYHERGLRYLAREPRIARRSLAKALTGVMKRAVSSGRAARLVVPNTGKEPLYVFLSLANPDGVPDYHYRSARAGMLTAYCKVAKLLHPETECVVGIATEPYGCSGRSEDLLCVDTRDWNNNNYEEARRIQRETRILINPTLTKVQEVEFPVVMGTPLSTTAPAISGHKKIGRNDPCPCGSGKKFKKCCGAV